MCFSVWLPGVVGIDPESVTTDRVMNGPHTLTKTARLHALHVCV